MVLTWGSKVGLRDCCGGRAKAFPAIHGDVDPGNWAVLVLLKGLGFFIVIGV
jgi:hypothetical protein